jgi:hypothetical protein
MVSRPVSLKVIRMISSSVSKMFTRLVSSAIPQAREECGNDGAQSASSNARQERSSRCRPSSLSRRNFLQLLVQSVHL